MFRHIDYLQFEAKPEKPHPAYTHKLQELIGGAVLGGVDPQQAIVPGGGPLLADSNGYPWNGRYIVASGNLLADFRANAAAETQGRVQTLRLYNMTDPSVRNMLKFNLARDSLHQNLWLEAIEELQADGLETTAAPNALFDEEYAEHATSVWHLSDGTAGHEGSWAAGPQPDGLHQFGYLLDPEPLGRPRIGASPRTRSCTRPTTVSRASLPPGPRHRNRPGRNDQGRPHLIGWRKPAVTGTATGPPDGACGRPERRPQAPARRKE
ncbi:MAG: manganese catalase family protein [Streptosporangiaceae bacterium]